VSDQYYALAVAVCWLQMIDDTDQASSAMTDIDPFWDMRSNSELDKRDPFRDRDQFWRK
jgi:hypothetical protein